MDELGKSALQKCLHCGSYRVYICHEEADVFENKVWDKTILERHSLKKVKCQDCGTIYAISFVGREGHELCTKIERLYIRIKEAIK